MVNRRIARSIRPAAAIVAAAGLAITSLVGVSPASAGTAKAVSVLNALAVSEENNAGYDRNLFTYWTDVDRDCQYTRHEVLFAESSVRPTFSSGWCKVLTGRWLSLYDGKTYSSASSVSIDHHIPLAEAWGSGARSWSSTDRTRFANDLYVHSLNGMTTSLNNDIKQANDPAEWLPTINRCLYAKSWVLVKYRWRLSIDAAEKAALSTVLTGGCGSATVSLPTRAR